MVDHCTRWPDTINGIYIGLCCLAHDIAYAIGADRLLADLELKACVAALGLPLTALIMFVGVRLFGRPFYNRRNRNE